MPEDSGDLAQRVQDVGYWYHKIPLPGGVETPGWAPINPPSYGVPDDLTGKRVLDVGAWDGYWTFEALRRGAREAVAIDDFSDHLGKLEDRSEAAWRNFDLCREALGFGEDRCKRIEMSVYDVDEGTLGRFHVVFFFGTLYHLRYPLLALDRLAAITDELLLVESAILDDYSPYRGGLGKGYEGEMVMEFYAGSQLGNNETNWWSPTLQCLGQMVRSCGFGEVKTWKLTDQPPAPAFCRGFVSARR